MRRQAAGALPQAAAENGGDLPPELAAAQARRMNREA